MGEQKSKQTKRVRKRKRDRRFLLNHLRKMDRKVAFLYVFLCLLFFILWVRVGYLQIVDADNLTREALALTTKSVKRPERGLIFDADGNKLVGNISKSDIYIDTNILAGAKDSQKEREKLRRLALKTLDMTEAKFDERMEKSGYVLLKNNVERSVALRLKDSDIPGLVVEDFEARTYPNNDLASLVIGFAGKEGDGRYGIEKYYDDALRLAPTFGKKKDSQVPINAGANLKLTISESLQRKVEDVLDSHQEKKHAHRMTAIVQETQTGAIRAMASTDDYDLNHPSRPTTKEQKAVWRDLKDEQRSKILFDNWRNFSVSDTYEPGSTFKTITAAAALEEDTTNPKKHYYCTGYVRDIPGVTITCTSLPNPHGDITMDKAFSESCNVTFVNIARELSKEGLFKYIQAFGFGEETGIDLPAEQKGIVPTNVKEINEARLATMSYGHGIAVTPIQMVTAVSAVANGGYLLKPYVVDEIQDVSGNVLVKQGRTVRRQVISETTSETMRTLLTHVVDHGTGTMGAVNRYHVGGKTGTAGKVSDTGGYEKDKYISSFVSVAPIEDPKYTVLVIVEEPEGDYFGGTVAAPIASEIMAAALQEGDVPPTGSDQSKKVKKVIVPDVKNLLLEDAGKVLTDAGLKFNMASENVGDFGMVIQQAPEAGTEVDENTIVDLKIDPNDGRERTVPNFRGKTKQEVEKILESSKLDYVLEGEGTVVSQEPLAGDILPKGAKIHIRFEADVSDKPSDDNAEANNRRETKEKTNKARNKAGSN